MPSPGTEPGFQANLTLFFKVLICSTPTKHKFSEPATGFERFKNRKPLNFSMFQFMLAPMEDYTDSAFRTLCYNHGADLTFTEVANVNGLVERNKETWKKLEWKDNTPTEIQILLGNDQKLEQFLKNFKPKDGFKGFNFNFGCPAPELIKSGRGCAMVRRIAKTNRLIKLVKKYNHSISIKMRLGATEFEKSAKVYLNSIKETNPDYFIVHARTGTQTYSNKPDYSVFSECASFGKTIIANGNIDSIQKIEELKKTGVHGVMIGRAAVQNPAIFDLLKGNKTPSIEELKQEYVFLSEKYCSNNRHKKNVLMRIGQKFPETL
jgi:tRNA-dihydrouridine synthase B